MHAWLGSLIGNIFKSALCVTATAKICPQNLQGPTIELLILRGLRGGGGGRLRVVVDFEKKILQARVEREKLQAARIKF